MIDKTEILAAIISEDAASHLISYATTMSVVANVINDMTADEDEDYVLAALYDIEHEAKLRYHKEMREIEEKLWERHGDTLRIFGADECDLHNAIAGFSDEVYDEVYERIAH